MPVIEVTSLEHFKELLNEEKTQQYLFVDFYAQWCGPCKRIAPLIEKHSTIYTNILFLKVDVDQVNELSDIYGIQSLPTFIVLESGKVKPMCSPIIGADPSKLENIFKLISGKIIPSDDF
jgi:thioredoxin 1